jgi:hypothetical protein
VGWNRQARGQEDAKAGGLRQGARCLIRDRLKQRLSASGTRRLSSCRGSGKGTDSRTATHLATALLGTSPVEDAATGSCRSRMSAPPSGHTASFAAWRPRGSSAWRSGWRTGTGRARPPRSSGPTACSCSRGGAEDRPGPAPAMCRLPRPERGRRANCKLSSHSHAGS